MHTLRNKLLFYGAAAGAGFASLGLHRYMMDHCLDEKGLLISWNLPGIGLLTVGGVFVVFLVLMARTLGGDGSYADNFPRDIFCGALMLAAGAALCLAVPGLDQPDSGGVQTIVLPVQVEQALALGAQALPWLAAASMAVAGVCRVLGRKPWPLFGGLICLFYMMMLVRNYRLWSADPQIHDYAYQLLAGVLLMLCSFHRTCCDAEIIQRQKLVMTGLLAAVCCLAAMSLEFQRIFYLASALWSMGCICVPAVLPPDPEPEPDSAGDQLESDGSCESEAG